MKKSNGSWGTGELDWCIPTYMLVTHTTTVPLSPCMLCNSTQCDYKRRLAFHLNAGKKDAINFEVCYLCPACDPVPLTLVDRFSNTASVSHICKSVMNMTDSSYPKGSSAKLIMAGMCELITRINTMARADRNIRMGAFCAWCGEDFAAGSKVLICRTCRMFCYCSMRCMDLHKSEHAIDCQVNGKALTRFLATDYRIDLVVRRFPHCRMEMWESSHNGGGTVDYHCLIPFSYHIAPEPMKGYNGIYTKRAMNACCLCGCDISKTHKRVCIRLMLDRKNGFGMFLAFMCKDCDPIPPKNDGKPVLCNRLSKVSRFYSMFFEAACKSTPQTLMRRFDAVNHMLNTRMCFYCVKEIDGDSGPVCENGTHTFCNHTCREADYAHKQYCADIPVRQLVPRYKIVLRKRFPTSNAGGF